MTTNEYNYLLSSIEELKDADAAFKRSYPGTEITEEQMELYHRLKYQLDEVYIMANMLLDSENYRRDRRKKTRSLKQNRDSR